MRPQLAYKDGFGIRKSEFSSSLLRTPLVSEIGNSLLKSKSGMRRRRQCREKPRVLLFVPPYTRMVEPAPEDSPLRKIGIKEEEVMKRAGTPIGLVRIATQAMRCYEVKLVDAPFEGWDQEQPLLYLPNGGKLLRYGLTDTQIRKIIEEFQPDVVGIQCNYTVQWGNARALADLVKTIDEKIVVVGGGSHTSGDWRNALVDSPIDIICINESDRSFTQLLDALTSENSNVDDVRGIAYRKNEELIRTDTKICGAEKSQYISIHPKFQALEERLDMFPLPDFSLLNMKLYEQAYHSAGARMRKTGAWAQIFSTIGCNVGCDFCYIPMVNGPWRALGTDWFDQHLASIKQHGVTEVLLEDDHLMHDPIYALQVFELLKKHDLPWVEEGGLSLFNLILLHKGESVLETLSEKEKRRIPGLYGKVLKALQSGVTAKSLIKSMAESGCYNAYLAVESANETSLEKSHKPKLNTIQEATIEIVEMMANAGIRVTGGFMLGFVNPSDGDGKSYIESVEQIEKTIEYAVLLMQHGMAYANPFIVTPLPGTPMHEFQKQYVVRDYDTGWSHERATLATEKWTADELETLRWKLMINANGIEKTKQMLSRGTWPV